MKIKKLIHNLPVQIYRGGKEIEITGLCSHSKSVAPGNLFIAKRGTKDDGTKYIEEAISAGAAAILTDIPNPFLKHVVQLVHPDVQQLEALLAARFYTYPSEELYVVGVTGTNGKTTVSYLIKHLLDQFHHRCGLIGTIEYIIGAHRFTAERTTPDVITNQKLLKEMMKNGCDSAVLEVTSHGIAQGRCCQIEFDAAVFTNLSQEHLDYHLTMEAYAKEKQKLFSDLKPDKHAIVNLDSLWSKTMLAHCQAAPLTYGFSSQADIYATDIQLSREETSFWVHYKGEKAFFKWKIIGRYNVSNCLAAIGVCLSKGIALPDLPQHVESFSPVAGRLEKVENLNHLHLFVDYAHTPDALEQVLFCLKEVNRRKLITVFGCGGDRDRGKRPVMGKIVEQNSDFAFITSDNPRHEDPAQICEEVSKGFISNNYKIVVNRRQAIEEAIEMATSEDLILIAGKGHETYQHFAHQTIPFDDRKIAQEIANKVFS